ncbi:MAG: ankyrin repeat domain-containing protein [Phycisphaeraceae bacterium]|nr:ankyrin repeat domain-containing protein [Phycisphaeraceae bacterium]
MSSDALAWMKCAVESCDERLLIDALNCASPEEIKESSWLFYECIRAKWPEGVRALADAGVPTTRAMDSLHTPLSYAARQSDIKSLGWLLAAGADPNGSVEDGVEELSVLSSAMGQPLESQLVSLLLAAGSDPSDPRQRGHLLLGRAWSGETVRLLISNGVTLGRDGEPIDGKGGMTISALQELVRQGVSPHDLGRDGKSLVERLRVRVERLSRLGDRESVFRESVFVDYLEGRRPCEQDVVPQGASPKLAAPEDWVRAAIDARDPELLSSALACICMPPPPKIGRAFAVQAVEVDWPVGIRMLAERGVPVRHDSAIAAAIRLDRAECLRILLDTPSEIADQASLVRMLQNLAIDRAGGHKVTAILLEFWQQRSDVPPRPLLLDWFDRAVDSRVAQLLLSAMLQSAADWEGIEWPSHVRSAVHRGPSFVRLLKELSANEHAAALRAELDRAATEEARQQRLQPRSNDGGKSTRQLGVDALLGFGPCRVSK